ncbi:MFS family permease [Lipingzhangella halophila]|uniref:MFS family permease n=1 Tax=Lipingzhangella halophila TaxID=1783352 RepID=A0A7W7W3Q1_9ACTN|nr:hypothetical protein [Lipingzhangella halophila]MBB4932039.1 MFS family permease [Lipingzhangella halophila]
MYAEPDTYQGRRWLVALVPAALSAAVPSALALVFKSDIAGQMFVGAVLASMVMAFLIGATTAATLARYQRSAPLQRQAAATSAAVSGLFGTQITLHVVSLIGVPPPDEIRWFGMNEASGWFWIAGVPVAAAVGALAWALARTGAPPVATGVPPEGTPAFRLGPQQRAMFAATVWVRSNLLVGAALLALGIAVTIVSATRDNTLAPGLVFTIIGLWLLAQSHAKLVIDERGVALATAGTLRSTIPYAHITQATALERSPRSATYPPGGSDHGWGACTGTGPALHLQLTEGRAFVFSTHEAKTAASLVNGYLHRERNDVDHD